MRDKLTHKLLNYLFIYYLFFHLLEKTHKNVLCLLDKATCMRDLTLYNKIELFAQYNTAYEPHFI